jgi:methionyl-tRNA formyltransferase
MTDTNKALPARTKVIFFGNERLATGLTTDAPTLRSLISAGYDIVAVVSHHTDSRSRNGRNLEIAEAAAEHGIPVLLPERPADIIEQLKAYDARIGVLVAYGKIVPESIINIFPCGIVNIHPSLLPGHRGPIPIESVILDGSRETGVSIMQLVRGMDAGPVYGQFRLPLSQNETKATLATALLQAGGALLLELLPGILDGSCQPAVQDDSAATYDERITKEAGVLDFTKPAEQLEREVRAYIGWPGSRTSVGNTDIIITAAHVEARSAESNDVNQDGQPGEVWRGDKQFGFYTAQGILVVDKLKPAGKPEMTAQAFLAGYQV